MNAEEVSNDPRDHFWARMHNIDITDELMAGMKVHGTCRVTDGQYTCCLNTGHRDRDRHIDLNDQFVVFEVAHGG